MCTAPPERTGTGLPRIALIALAATALLGSAQLIAQEAAPDAFVALFSTTCMKFYNSGDKLKVAMKQGGFAELGGDASKFFLNGKTGVAWSVPVEEKRYVVTLRDDGICTAFAQHAEIEKVRKDFTRLVSRATPPLQARSLPGGPTGTAVQTITYAWATATDAEQLVFSLTTSTNPTAPVQAMATVALAAKSP